MLRHLRPAVLIFALFLAPACGTPEPHCVEVHQQLDDLQPTDLPPETLLTDTGFTPLDSAAPVELQCTPGKSFLRVAAEFVVLGLVMGCFMLIGSGPNF